MIGAQKPTNQEIIVQIQKKKSEQRAKAQSVGRPEVGNQGKNNVVKDEM